MACENVLGAGRARWYAERRSWSCGWRREGPPDRSHPFGWFGHRNELAGTESQVRASGTQLGDRFDEVTVDVAGHVSAAEAELTWRPQQAA